MQSELKPCDFCGSSDHLRVIAVGVMTRGMPDRPHRVICSHIDHDDVQGPVAYGRAEAITAWNTRASDAEITRLTEALRAAEAQVKGLREALESKPWPPTDADLREMLALIVGAWWSESSANRLRTARVLNAEDIKGMYAVRDALAPYIARAALKGPSHDA